MTDTPKVVFIGLGIMAHRMLTGMARYGGFSLHAAWDPDPEACRKAAESFPGMHIGESAAAIIEDPQTDLVYIACPPAFHAEYARAAAAAGKTIFCEKPLGVDLADSQALVAEVARTGIKTAVNFPFAEAEAVEAIAVALANGTIGDVRAIDIRLHFCKWPRDWQEPAAWLSERAQGGFVRETFSHYVFLIRKLFGDLRLLDAINRHADDGVSAETQSLALFDCNGLPVTFAGGVGGPDANGGDRVEFTVWGSQASFRIYDWNRLAISDGGAWRDRPSATDDPRQDGYRRMLGNLGRFYRGEAHSMPDFNEAFAVQQTVEALLAKDR